MNKVAQYEISSKSIHGPRIFITCCPVVLKFFHVDLLDITHAWSEESVYETSFHRFSKDNINCKSLCVGLAYKIAMKSSSGCNCNIMCVKNVTVHTFFVCFTDLLNVKPL